MRVSEIQQYSVLSLKFCCCWLSLTSSVLSSCEWRSEEGDPVGSLFIGRGTLRCTWSCFITCCHRVSGGPFVVFVSRDWTMWGVRGHPIVCRMTLSRAPPGICPVTCDLFVLSIVAQKSVYLDPRRCPWPVLWRVYFVETKPFVLRSCSIILLRVHVTVGGTGPSSRYCSLFNW